MGQQNHIWPFDSSLLFPGVLFLESTKSVPIPVERRFLVTYSLREKNHSISFLFSFHCSFYTQYFCGLYGMTTLAVFGTDAGRDVRARYHFCCRQNNVVRAAYRRK